MAIRIVPDKIALSALKLLALEIYGDMIKCAADLERGVVAFGGQMHKDARAMLIADGSLPKNIWGFCFFLERAFPDAIEFNSHINIKPDDGNPSLKIKDAALRAKLLALIDARIDWNY